MPLSQANRNRTVTKATCLHAFFNFLHLATFHIFALSSDWFIALFSFDVVGQSKFFKFGFNISLKTTLTW